MRSRICRVCPLTSWLVSAAVRPAEIDRVAAHDGAAHARARRLGDVDAADIGHMLALPSIDECGRQCGPAGRGREAGRGPAWCQVSLAGTKQRIVPLTGERHTMPRAIGFEVTVQHPVVRHMHPYGIEIAPRIRRRRGGNRPAGNRRSSSTRRRCRAASTIRTSVQAPGRHSPAVPHRRGGERRRSQAREGRRHAVPNPQQGTAHHGPSG